jgi:hypothetical protein
MEHRLRLLRRGSVLLVMHEEVQCGTTVSLEILTRTFSLRAFLTLAGIEMTFAFLYLIMICEHFRHYLDSPRAVRLDNVYMINDKGCLKCLVRHDITNLPSFCEIAIKFRFHH